jgi:hypothetical protein
MADVVGDGEPYRPGAQDRDVANVVGLSHDR